MQNITVSGGQTLLDIAAQHTGDISRVFEIAELNGFDSITVDLEPGTSIKVPAPEIDKQQMVKKFAETNVVPASTDVANAGAEDEGIDFWAIEEDFIVQDN